MRCRWTPTGRHPGRIVGLLAEAGLLTRARLLREPERPEKVPQAYLLAEAARSAA